MVTDVTIHTDIPIPESFSVRQEGRGVYKFASLTAHGHSFSYPLIRNKKEQQERSLRGAIGEWKKRHPGTEFVYNLRGNRWFVWRTDHPEAQAEPGPAEDATEEILGSKDTTPEETHAGGGSNGVNPNPPGETAGDGYPDPEGPDQQADRED